MRYWIFEYPLFFFLVTWVTLFFTKQYTSLQFSYAFPFSCMHYRCGAYVCIHMCIYRQAHSRGGRREAMARRKGGKESSLPVLNLQWHLVSNNHPDSHCLVFLADSNITCCLKPHSPTDSSGRAHGNWPLPCSYLYLWSLCNRTPKILNIKSVVTDSQRSS